MKNKLAMKRRKGPAVPTVAMPRFQPFVLSILSVADPQRLLSSTSIYERLTPWKLSEWHWVSRVAQINGCPRSIPPNREARQVQKEGKPDYHSINKTNCNLKQEQKQKAASVFSPRRSLCDCVRAAAVCHTHTQAHPQTHTLVYWDAPMLVMALFLRKVNSSHFSMLRWWEGKKCQTYEERQRQKCQKEGRQHTRWLGTYAQVVRNK